MFDNDDDSDMNPIDKFMKLPIYQKGMEIVDLVDAIINVLPEDNPMLADYKQMMRADALIIPAKIAGASNHDMLYSIRMQNAAIIRKAAMDLQVSCSGLAMFDVEEERYLELLREAIEEFRILFLEWVESFDPWNYVIDRWGLFNPPGVTAHDKDPDDDIPFDPDSFFPEDPDLED